MSYTKGPASEAPGEKYREQAGALRVKAPPKPKERPRPSQRHPSPPPDSRGNELIGRTLAGRYQVEGILGRGTMGVVYSCRHLVLDRSVAIKILKPDLAQDEEVLQRFMTEAKAASSIGSQHIVDVLDFGVLADGSSYLVMEQLRGQTLGELLAASPLLPEKIVLSIALQIAEGLEAAHAAGVVHRDLKPDNVFLTETAPDEYFVTILDFGIAKVQASQNKLTQQGTLVGTPHYMSPEQATAGPADQRADIYSLGVILFELAAGQVPFDGETPVAVLTRHVHDKPPSIESLLPAGRSLPRGLEAVIRKCLAKKPERRYQSMRELKSDLESLLSGSAPDISFEVEQEANEVPPSIPTERTLKPLFLLALLVAALLGAAWSTHEYLTRQATPTIVTVAAPPKPVQAPTPPPSEPEPAGTKVDLILFPLDSHVFKDKEDLGQMPVSVHVPEGEKLILLVKRNGYWPRRLVLDGSKQRIVVGLRKYTLPATDDDVSEEPDAGHSKAEADEAPQAAEEDSSDTPENTKKAASAFPGKPAEKDTIGANTRGAAPEPPAERPAPSPTSDLSTTP